MHPLYKAEEDLCLGRTHALWDLSAASPANSGNSCIVVMKGHTYGNIKSQVLPAIITPYVKSHSKMLAPPGREEDVRSVHTSELLPDLFFKNVLHLFIEGRG